MPAPPLTKIAGERAECAFAWRAMEHGFIVSKPYGDSAPYDFILQRWGWIWRRDFRGRAPRLLRVQVKSVHTLSANSAFRINTKRMELTYSSAQIDFFALWVAPHDAWYLVPVKVLAHVTGIALYPHVPHSRGKYEKYREAWGLLGE